MAAKKRGVIKASIKVVSIPTLILLSSLAIAALSISTLPKYLTPSISESVFSLAFFLVSSYFLGYTLTHSILKSADSVERHVMRVGLGISSLPILYVVLESVGVPLRWYSILGISLIRPIIINLNNPIPTKPHIQVDLHTSIAFLVAALALAASLYGHYMYSSLEDGGSWEHAVGAKYVSIYGKYTQPRDKAYVESGRYMAHYLPPYPPAYDVLMGLTHQLNSSINWTLKVFNALMVSLTYLFAYFFVRRLTGNSLAALYSTIVLFALPPFGSHTIWAHTLSIAALFPLFYSVDRIREDKRWSIPSIICLTSSLVIEPLMSAVVGVFYLSHLLSRTLHDRREFQPLLMTGVIGLMLSLLYWVPAYYDPLFNGSQLGITDNPLHDDQSMGIGNWVRIPSASETFFPGFRSAMYLQPGLGVVPVLLLLASIDYLLRRNPLKYLPANPWHTTMLIWLASTASFLFGLVLPFTPARFWAILAIPTAILSGHIFANMAGIHWIPKKHKRLVIIALLIGLVFFSLYPKLSVQISQRPSELRLLFGDFEAYRYLQGLPADTLVYNFCANDAYVIGFDKMGLPWDPKIYSSRKDVADLNPERLYSLLKPRGYKYAIFDYACVTRCMVEEGKTQNECQDAVYLKLKKLEDSTRFKLLFSSKTTNAFKIN